MSSVRLTETSYIVLGLLERIAPATPYDLKQLAKLSTVNFWTVPHTQLYSESARLAQAGLLSEERERSGRRRRIYRLTDAGSQALQRWREEPSQEPYELRDIGILKLFFGAEPAALAELQLQAHTRRLQRYEELKAGLADAPEGWRLALEGGIGHEHEFIRFWSRLVRSG